MTRRLGTSLLIASAVALIASARWPSLAQEEAPRPAPSAAGKGRATLEEALLKPFTFPFAKETSLDDVAKVLGRALDAAVVLDLAAVKRLGHSPETKVRLDLRGVRLKTGLKLLLDQVEMTYKVVPEDNLLVLTDAAGSDDPSARIFSELKTLHREIHDLRDAFDELNDSLVPADEEGGPNVRKPTIIEEMPDGAAKPKDDEPPARSRPGL